MKGWGENIASGSGSGLSLLHELGVKAAVADGFAEIAARLAVQRCKPTVRSHQSGKHAETGFEGEHSALTMS